MLVLSVPAAGGTIARRGSQDLGNNGGGANPFTVAYTVNAASNALVLVVVGGYGVGVQDVSSATYGGVTMTVAGSQVAVVLNNTRCMVMFYLSNPGGWGATLTNNFVITKAAPQGDTFIIPVAADYSGVNSLDGAVQTPNSGGAGVTSLSAPSASLTSASSWVISAAGPQGITSNDHLTQVAFGSQYGMPYLYDSNGAVGATGVFANTFTTNGTACGTVVVGVKP
jgi:hypothetical protein